jgi:hypothetical protein
MDAEFKCQLSQQKQAPRWHRLFSQRLHHERDFTESLRKGQLLSVHEGM